MKTRLCSVADIEDNTTREFKLYAEQQEFELFVVHKQKQMYAYLNQCPHTGVNLNWVANQFFDIDNNYIQCATHGALFRIEDGYCVRGPCAGMSLKQLPIESDNESIYITLFLYD